MAATPPVRSGTTTTVGGAMVALTGLLLLPGAFGIGRSPVLFLLATVALAVGSGVLAFGPGGIVGTSRVGRTALVVFGVGPLVSLLPLERAPWPVLLGMSILVLVTIATVVAAASVASSAVLHGVARWTLVAVAIDALLTLALSSVTLGNLPFVYLGWHLDLVCPLALLIWGLSIVVHGRASAIRARVSAINTAWKRSTDVAGATSEVRGDRNAHL